MKIVLQRVKSASVQFDNTIRSIEKGLVLLVGISPEDTEKTAELMAEKAVNLRIFEDEADLMNLSLLNIGGEILAVSNFTLYANCRKGRRPSFTDAAKPEHALPLYDYFCSALIKAGAARVETGSFGAEMQVTLTNDGPVTIVLDSKEIL